MARRMFSDEVTTSDAFLDMPSSSQLLYFHLGMTADDDGFIGSPKMIMRQMGASEDDYKILTAKKFVIVFESGICVIKHWRINNFVRKDIYKETRYVKEKAQLFIRDNSSYTLNPENAKRIPKGHFTVERVFKNLELPRGFEDQDVTLTQRQRDVNIGKVRIGKDRIDKNTSGVFIKPTVEEVTAYCKERNNTIDPETFIDFYESKGWMIGKNKMKDWKAGVRTWERSRTSSKDAPKNVLHTPEMNDRIKRIQSKTK